MDWHSAGPRHMLRWNVPQGTASQPYKGAPPNQSHGIHWGSSILQTKIMPVHQSLQTKQQPKPTIAKHVFPLRCDKKEPKCSFRDRSQLFRMKGTKTFLQRLRRLQLEPFLSEKVGFSHPAVYKNPSHTNNPRTHFGVSELCHGKKNKLQLIWLWLWLMFFSCPKTWAHPCYLLIDWLDLNPGCLCYLSWE